MCFGWYWWRYIVAWGICLLCLGHDIVGVFFYVIA